MLKYLPKDKLAQWAVGSIAVAGAASLVYVLVFPSDSAPPDLPRPAAIMVETGEAPNPEISSPPDIQTALTPTASEFAPRFDVVRVTELGDVLIAGQAPASSAVSALIDESHVAQAVSSAAGEFVMMFEIAPSPAPQVLELEVRLPSGERVRSSDTLMLAPRSPVSAADTDTPAQIARTVEPEPLFPDVNPVAQPDLAEAPEATAPAEIRGELGSEPPEMAAEPAEITTPDQPIASAGEPSEPQPPLALLVRSDGGVRMLGPAPELTDSDGRENISIDSVVYDAEGEVAISGRTGGGTAADIQIYLDNQPILRARAAPDGNWQAQLAGIERGVYRLRVDELDEEAQVTSRAEIPFQRATPDFLREGTGPQALIVQPGNTLWAMSEQQYGDGLRYIRIFDANRDQIRNPDLIYPGQVFVLPEAED